MSAAAGVDGTNVLSLREVLGRTLVDLTAERDDIVVLDGDLANSTRVDIVAAEAPDRFIQVGIAEQNLLGIAAGLATMGFTPFVSTFACFAVARAHDQIRVTVAQPGLNVKIAGGYSGILTGSTGKTHQLVDDLAILRAMPGMTIIAPADDLEAEAAIRLASTVHGPVYLRLVRDPVERVFQPGDRLEPGLVRWVEPRGDILLVSTGTQTSRTMLARRVLLARGIECALLHVPFVKPLDSEGLVAAIAGRRLVVSVEEHTIIGGLGGAVAEVMAESGGPPLRRVGLRDEYGESGTNDALLDKFGLSPARVAASIVQYARDLDLA